MNHDKTFQFSIIYWIDTEEDLDTELSKLIGEEKFLKDQIDLLLMDSVCSEATEKQGRALAEQYPDNVRYFALEGNNLAQCCNTGLKEARGEYIHFTKATVGISDETVQQVSEFLLKNQAAEILCLFPTYCDIKGKKIDYLAGKAETSLSSIEEDDVFNLYLFSYFFKKETLNDLWFDEHFSIDSEVDYLIHVLMKNEKYYFTDIELECSEMLETDFYNYASLYEKDWYTKSLEEIFLPLLKRYQGSRFVQNAVTYLVELRFAANRNDRNKNILLDEELTEFFDVLRAVLQEIPDDILVKYTFAGRNLLPKYMGLVLLRFKHNDETLMPVIYESAEEFVAVYKQAMVDKSQAMKVNVMAIDYEKSGLVLDGEVTNAYMLNFDKIQVFAEVKTAKGKARYAVKQNSIYSLDKYFGFSMKRGYTFQVHIPLNMKKQLAHDIVFYLKYGNCKIRLPLVFTKSQARLVNEFSYSYWRFANYVLFYENKTRALTARPCDTKFLVDREAKLMLQYLRQAKTTVDKKRSCKSIALRSAYWMTKPFMEKKQTWMTFDQLFKGGDNGEYFFRYVDNLKRDDLDIYYVINKDSDDYKRLKENHKNVLGFNTIYHKLMTLHTDNVFATRVDVKLYCGFGPELDKYFRGLLDYKIFCLQHGLTIQRIAQYQNRLFDNTRLYFCVSPYEIDNLMHPVYGYERDVLKLTGAPRFDGLVNNDKRQILITPTWRRNVTSGTNKKGYMHDYSPNFKSTEYFRLYNSLINDERLIECAKRCGYRLIYLLHPILSPQIDDFDRNDYVEILAGANNDLNYEKILTESSLMVTDYSGVQFDFAYMRKPIVYYHPDTLPPQYDAGGLDYDTMSFGPVCKNHEQIVDQLCAYMEKDCKLEQVYIDRANHFFAFDDHNNCKRVFEAAMEYLKDEK